MPIFITEWKKSKFGSRNCFRRNTCHELKNETVSLFGLRELDAIVVFKFQSLSCCCRLSNLDSPYRRPIPHDLNVCFSGSFKVPPENGVAGVFGSARSIPPSRSKWLPRERILPPISAGILAKRLNKTSILPISACFMACSQNAGNSYRGQITTGIGENQLRQDSDRIHIQISRGKAFLLH